MSGVGDMGEPCPPLLSEGADAGVLHRQAIPGSNPPVRPRRDDAWLARRGSWRPTRFEPEVRSSGESCARSLGRRSEPVR